jgi:hypothetical protein
MIQLISPHYTYKKLEPPFYRDLVDVFEDRMRYWMLYPAKKLLGNRIEQVAALGILLNYLEAIEIYVRGEDSKNKSYEFFKNSFSKVFAITVGDESAIDECAKALYLQARCGFAHDGGFRNRVYVKDSTKNAIITIWPKKDGEFVFDKGVESIIINPIRFYKIIEIHFENYLEKLKLRKDKDIVDSFKNAVDLKWGLDIEHVNFGMSEEEFNNKY